MEPKTIEFRRSLITSEVDKSRILRHQAHMGFLEDLKAGAMVIDGAMGTALYEQGLLYTSSLDAASLTRPEVVRKVHESYVRAGAHAITTNTFGANRFRLQPHGLSDRIEDVNRASLELARDAADGRAVLASVGPTGTLLKTMGALDLEQVRDSFREQARVLKEGGTDAILLETFRQPAEIRLALEGVRAGSRGEVPVVACVSFDAFGTMADGTEPEQMAQALAQWGADAVGVNCSDGPAGVYEMIVRMTGSGLPLIAIPNAGLPRRVEGRFAYRATPEYFQLYARRFYKAGVHAVGGCCGATFEHIRKVVAAARMAAGQANSSEDMGGGGSREMRQHRIASAPGVEVSPVMQKGKLGAKIGTEFVVSVEVNPPPGLSLDKALHGAAALKEGGVDVINVADGPRASARMGNIALCLRIEQQLQMPALMHVTTRDRNLLASVAHLLAAHELGVRNLVVITGDPPKMGDFPDATPVYDTDSIGLIRLIKAMNHGYDPGGKPIGAATSFLIATGAEPAAQDYEREIRRLEQKIEAGAEFIMTQPVYDPEVLDRFLKDIQHLNTPVLVGLLPLASHRNAEFLHNEVPGMRIPEEVRERMRGAGMGSDARAVGVSIAREMLMEVRDRVHGAYIMPPFARYKTALDVIKGVVAPPES
ncbi:MAG: bifunctional homocysteine S-methyltransferase/methylenetetrahydrofolate reductase [Myxococcota bacterium]